MDFIDRLFRKPIVLSYIKILPKTLRDDFGDLEYYSTEQIEAAIEKKRLSKNFLHYAIACFGNEKSYASYTAEHQLPESCQEVRSIIKNYGIAKDQKPGNSNSSVIIMGSDSSSSGGNGGGDGC